MKQRVWSLILALAMVLSLFPSPVWAEGETTTAVEYLDEKGDTQTASCVELTASTTTWEKEWYVVQQDTTISGKVTVSEDYQVKLILCDGATLTINGSVTLYGETTAPQLTIYGQSVGTGRMTVTNKDGSALIGVGATAYIRLLGGTLTATGSGKACVDVDCWNHYTEKCVPNDPVKCVGDPVNDSTVTISKCLNHDFEYLRNTAKTQHAHVCKLCGYSTTWNDFATNEYVNCVYDQYVPVDSEYHSVSCICGNVKTSAEAHTMGNNGVCTKCYYGATAAAKIDDVEYPSLPVALKKAKDGDTVTLLVDHVTDWDAVKKNDESTLVIVTKELTLDLSTYTIDYLEVGDVTYDRYNEETGKYENISFTPGDLTVVCTSQGSLGKIIDLNLVKGTLDIQNGQLGDDEGGQLTCNGDSGDVTIRGGMVRGLTVGDGATVTVSGGSQHAGNWFNYGTLTITGGTFSNVYFRNNGGTIAISGGTFGSIVNNNASTLIPPMSLLAKGYAFYDQYEDTLKDGSQSDYLRNVTVKEHTHNIVDGKCDCGLAAVVSDSKGDFYNTLQAALDAAAKDSTIEWVQPEQDLTEQITFNAAGKTVTVKMNGKTLTAPNNDAPALTVSGGTLIFADAATISMPTTADPYNQTITYAVSISGGKLVFQGKLTAEGGVFNVPGNRTVQMPAVYANGGELDFQGDLDLKSGLTISGNAKLTRKLTQGTFRTDYMEGDRLSVTGASNYKYLEYLLEDGYAFVDKDDHNVFRCVSSFTFWSGSDVTIVPHEHTWGPDGELYSCTACGKSCGHPDGYPDGKCPVCGKPCPHAIADQSPVDHKYYCNDCHEKMVARIQTDTYAWSHFTNLKDAMAAAEDGQTILLLDDIDNSGLRAVVTGDGKTVTLDLNGHTVTGGWIQAGYENWSDQTASTLKIVGSGSFINTGTYGNLSVGYKATVDLSGWVGENNTISRVSMSKRGSDEAELIVSENIGTIGTLGFNSWPSSGIKTKLTGGSYGEISIVVQYDSEPYSSMLAPGYAFQYIDTGDYVNCAETATNKGNTIYNVKVVKCTHGGTNGFEINSTNTCPYCGTPAVAYTGLLNVEGNPWRNFANLQDALDSDRAGGSVLRLLADVTGDYTIDGTKTTGMDLNGHTIHGTVYAKAVEDEFLTTSFSNSESTGSIETVIASAGAKLANSGAPAIIGTLKLAEGATWANILQFSTLGYKVFNEDGTYKWYASADVPAGSTELNNVVIGSLPITSNTLSFKVNGKNVSSVERGTTVQLCAYCNTSGAEVTFYVGEEIEGVQPAYSQQKATYEKIGSSWYYVVDWPFSTSGKYSIYFTATKDGYSVSSDPKTLNVTKASIPTDAITAPTARELTYNGSEQELIVPGKLDAKYGTILYSLTRSASSFSTTIPKGTDAGTYRVYYKVVGSADYKDIGVKNISVTIAKKVLTITGVTLEPKTYDGTETVNPKSVTFNDDVANKELKLGNYSLGVSFDSTDAGTSVPFTATVKLIDAKNYTLENGTYHGYGEIKKAAAPTDIPTGTLNVINGTWQAYTYDFKQLLPNVPLGRYGTISYYCNPSTDITLDSGYTLDLSTVEFDKSDNSKLILASLCADEGTATGKIGTVTVRVTTTNYEDFNLTLVLNAKNRITPTVDGAVTASEITYGDTLSKSTINGTMKAGDTVVPGEFEWVTPNAQLTVKDNQAEWKFIPTDGDTYAETTGKVNVKVNPKSLTDGKVTMNSNDLIYNGKEQAPTVTSVIFDNKPDGFEDRLLVAGTDYEVIVTPQTNANINYALTIQGKGNYTGAVEETWMIAQKVVANPTIEVASGSVYTGEKREPAVTVKDGDTVIPESEYTLSYSNNIDAGNAAKVEVTNRMDGNYQLGDVGMTTFTEYFTIAQAAAPSLTALNLSQKYNQVTERTITLPDLKTLGMPADAKVPGSNAFHGGTYSPVDLVKTGWGVDVNTGAITYALENSVKVGDVITFTLKVRSQNYEDATLTVVLTLTDLDTPVVQADAIAVDYTGQPVPDSAITGTATFNGQPVAGTWSWKAGQKITNVGDCYEDKIVIFTPNDTENYKTVETTVQLTIKRVPAKYLTKPTANTLTYNGQAQELVTPGTASGGTVKYALDSNWDDWSETIPTATEAGTYQVTCQVVSDGNHNNVEGPSLTVIIAPAALTGVSAQQSGTLTYTGQPQSASVTTAATVVGGQAVTFTYSGKEDGDYTAEVPAFTDAGTYDVYFKASAPNHTEVTGSFTVTIGQAEATFTAPTAKELTYSGQAQALVSGGSAQGGTMKYRLGDSGEWTTTVPTGKNAGAYTLWYKVEGDSNHTGIAARSVTVTISPKPVTATVTVLGGPFTYTGKAIEPNITVKDGETVIAAGEYTVSITDNTNAGTATVTVTDKAGGNYIVTGSATFTIEKAAPAVTAPTATELIYNGQDQALVSGGSTPDGTVKYSLDGENYTTDIPTGKNAGAYTLWYKVEGDSNHTDVAAEKISVTIAKREITIADCTVADKTYTGETGGTVTAVTFGNLANSDTLALGSDFSAEAVFASADAESGISVAVTVRLLDSALAGNYSLADGTFRTTGKIVPAQAPAAQEGSIEIVNELEHTYTLDLSKLLPTLTAPAQFGTLEYGRLDVSLGAGYGTIASVDKDGILSLKIVFSNSERTGEVGTITIPVITRNYGTFALTVKVTARNKPIPQGAPVLSKNILVYGERLSTITLSGEMKVGDITVPGTFSWDEVDEPLQAGEHTLSWTFTPADGDAYRAAHGTATVTVSPATLSGTAEVSTLPNGGMLGDVTLTPDASWPDGDFVWLDQDGNVLPDDTKVTANASYTWEFRPADSRNYLPARGTAVLWHYTPITPVGPAKPDEPQPGGQDDGKPGFSDVGEDDWFAPAVDWAADNNITGGVGNGLFAPNGICTRGQIVTFLWRAAGSPEPAGESGFADVAADAYYAKAVAWAVERGITGGIGNGLFAPDMVCTRAQIVTFLWRAAGMPAPQSGVNPFSDVPADAWYAQAVLWAVEKGITTGVGNGLFGPQVPCTRAQVVTFLYRADSVK